MADEWAAAWSAWRFNPFHAPAGKAGGGEFTTSSGAGPAAKAGKPAAGHAAPPSAAATARAARKARLLAQARADRAEAAVLEKQLHQLLQQHAHTAAAAKHAAHAAKQAHGSPGKTLTAKQHHAQVTHRTHQRLTQRITQLRHRIATLLAQARQLTAQAAAL